MPTEPVLDGQRPTRADYEAATRERWISAGAEITTMLLQGADEEDVLEHIVNVAMEIGSADTAALILPGLQGELTAEIVHGNGAGNLLGLVMPREGMSWNALRTGEGHLVDSLAAKPDLHTEALRAYGPALYAPMGTAEQPVGVLLLMRSVGGHVFDAADLRRAQSFAKQAALALVLADARQAQAQARLVEERERIARDLHDLAIQQLFATGMQLEVVRRRAGRGLDKAGLIAIVDEALTSVDSSVREIRSVVRSLRDPDAASGVVERLRRESSLARTGLGFAPSLLITLDGRSVGDDAEDEELFDSVIVGALADDVVAVVREGLANAARHAQASSVSARISLSTQGGGVTVEVEDDGIGLGNVSGRKSGTWNLAARARQHAGESVVRDAPSGHGTLLHWHAPVTLDPAQGAPSPRP
ncbi:GAF domain-containing sensor histidine kinase [Rarobacter incanus]|uniref:GAF domain-containing protein n=1 Tax=Rarobacter incanus TaxID=153494 RepID=A0A542SN83_9MICO|nr:histidine kinase [Rarobacter incanus]TQK76038.1 GAF domain-containing protein [Rarobacter incanus]